MIWEMESKPERLIKKTYLACIRNSVGTRMFRQFFIKQEEKVLDAMKNGDLSCAFYVSGLLRIANLNKSIHGTIESTVKDLEESGWEKVKIPVPGDIIVWEASPENDMHKHIGFYLGRNLAVSNSSSKRRVTRHNWTYDGKRKVTAIYHNPKR
jgi:hypothetical protein